MATPSNPEFAMLSFDFLKIISEESAILSNKAEEFLEFEESCSLIAMIKPELVMMHMSLKSLNESCIEALETCLIDEDMVVNVPAAHFLRIADSSAMGMNAYKEVEKHISFLHH